MPKILNPISIGPLRLRSRVFMAPLTRCRAAAGNVPHALNATYYRQRAAAGGAGLIYAEATQICPEGQGYPNTPGIHSPEQVAGWKLVTDAVHEVGGTIFLQLWHVGRVSHNAYQPGGKAPVAPSAIAREGLCRLPDGSKQPAPVPRALETDEIPGIIAQYRIAADNARRAGFDGVQVHGANSYLPEQFLRDSSNKRTDRYGGSLENRARFLLDATRACIDVWGPERVCVRLSPSGWSSDFTESTPRETYAYVVRELDKLAIGSLEIREGDDDDNVAGGPKIPISFFRPLYRGVLVANTSFTHGKADEYLARGDCDAVAFGKPFISNPDLAARFERGLPLAPWDVTTFYPSSKDMPLERGYTDYPRAT